MKKQKIICFDVDGVLLNSDDETTLVSWNEYNLWLKDLGLPYQRETNNISDVPKKWAKIWKSLSIYANKNYHRLGINILILSKINSNFINSNIIHSLSEIDEVQKKITIERVNSIRKKIINDICYENLIKPFKEVDYNWVYNKHKNGELYLITNNPFSIVGLTKIAFKPIDDYVRTINTGIYNKSIHINEIKKKFRVNDDKIMFVDDKLPSLYEVKSNTNLFIDNIIQNNWTNNCSNINFKSLSFNEITNQYNKL